MVRPQAGHRRRRLAAAGTSGDPEGYGRAVAGELFPDVLPYVIGTPATYGFAVRNGRTLADNAPEAMLSLVTGMAVPSGLKPAVAQDQRAGTFPYVVPACPATGPGGSAGARRGSHPVPHQVACSAQHRMPGEVQLLVLGEDPQPG